MYTLVMMTALATAPDAAQFNGFFRDLAGGSGCRSDTRSQSDGTNCQGSSCNGCCGGGLFHGRIMSFFNFFGSCNGSCRSNSNSSCNGRSAGSTCHGNSCNGSRRDRDPGYSSSCQGTGYSSSCFGSSCMGNTFPPMTIPGDFAQPIPTNSGYGNGCIGAGVPSYPSGPPTILPGGGYDTVPFSPSTPVPSGSERDTYRPTVVDERTRGIIVVRLPEDAKLFAEVRQLMLKSDVRRFVTPPLPADRDAVYNLRIEYTRDGEVISRTKQVQIRAGDTKTLEFHEQSVQNPSVNPPELFADKPALGSPMAPPISAIAPIPSTSLPMGTPTVNKPLPLPPLGGGSVTVIPPSQALSDRAKITVKLPAGATLFVDSKKNDRTDTVREFTTPVLKKGELYAYKLRLDWSRNGQPESEERKVEFMAGEMHTVDFTPTAYRASK